MTPVEFRGDLWLQKTRVAVLSCGVVCVILHLAVLVELRLLTDGQTDRQTDGRTLTVSCFSKIQIGFTFLVPAHLGSRGKRAVKQVCVCSLAVLEPRVGHTMDE